jgi:hypothetical protein
MVAAPATPAERASVDEDDFAGSVKKNGSSRGKDP